MDMLTSIHGKRFGLGHNDEVIAKGKELILDNEGVPQRVLAAGSAKFVAAGAALTMTVKDHAGKVIKLDTLAGSVATLPAATGSGTKYKFLVTVLATSNSHKIQVANANDTMAGIILGSRVDSGNAVHGFAAGATSDTITLNRTTTGSVSLGEWIEVEDVAANLYAVNGVLTATGAAFATPFSAAVS